jgi:hypothetical protein
MYKKVEGGRLEVVQGIDCWIPPVGYGVDRITGDLVHIGVYSKSPKKSEQKWERVLLPDNYESKRAKEKARQRADPDYFDPELESVRERHWSYRRCGFWFRNNGVDTYITGTHWYYLNWCVTNIGYMDYRNTDRRIFYCLASIEADDRAGGLVYVSRRRGGKTYLADAWLLDGTSIARDKVTGMQSKTDEDAKLVFSKLINYFVNLPHFFQPIYDISQGLRPKKELRFYKTTIKGKHAEDILEGDELRSVINYGSSESFYYDGNALFRYLMDEFGKPQRSNVWDTWNIVRYCMDQDGRWVGKALVTSTIEDLDVTGQGPRDIWKNSDQSVRDANGRTTSGLYRLFFGAHESTFFDEYGNELVEKGLQYYNNMRKGFSHDTRQLSSIIRKNPFTIEEAFRIDGEKCIYDSGLLNERLDRLTWKENLTTRGDFSWENGERDTRVIWTPSKTGRWEVCWMFDDDKDSNKVVKRGESFYPNNNLHFVLGVDPFDHKITEDGRMSKGACVVMRKRTPFNENEPHSRSFVAKYCHRPELPSMFYEDVLMASVFFGGEILYENNKDGIMRYFEERGYASFMMWLPERAKPGIAATESSKQYGAELTDAYIKQDIDRVFFKELIQDWLEFKVDDSTKYDLAMAAMWCLVGEKAKVHKKDREQTHEVKSFFKTYKIAK